MGRLAPWRTLPVRRNELCIDTTLRCGQSFRWRQFGDEWRCSLHGRILALRQDADGLHYRATFPDRAVAAATTMTTTTTTTTTMTTTTTTTTTAGDKRGDDADADEDTEGLLRRYLNLQVDVGALYDQWSRDDANFRHKAPRFSGIRILNQDAWEALVCFICSSNNNIARISQMAEKLCAHYGPLLGHLDGTAYHDFPAPAALAAPPVEAHLRRLGFGYRAKYIAQTAQTLCAKPAGWLEQLRNPQAPGPGAAPSFPAGAGGVGGSGAACVPSYRTAHEQLLLLAGVGPKVADCVCLMGLGWGEAVPVDTHVWQIAVRDYKLRKAASKTFSKAMHDAVGDHFRALWGPYAGWAQSVLFTANLKSFAEQLRGDGDEGRADAQATVAGKRRRPSVMKVEETPPVDAEDAPAQARPKRRQRRR